MNKYCSGISAWGGAVIANNFFECGGIEVSNCQRCPSNVVIHNRIYQVSATGDSHFFSLPAGISFYGYGNIIKDNVLIENDYAFKLCWNYTPYNIVVNNTIKSSKKAAFLIFYINWSSIPMDELMRTISPLITHNILINNRREFDFAWSVALRNQNKNDFDSKIFLFPILGLLVTIVLFGFFYVHFRKKNK
jgi:hypothetical protein